MLLAFAPVVSLHSGIGRYGWPETSGAGILQTVPTPAGSAKWHRVAPEQQDRYSNWDIWVCLGDEGNGIVEAFSRI